MKKTLAQFIVYILLLWGSFFSTSLFADSGTLYGAHHLQNGWIISPIYTSIDAAGDAACTREYSEPDFISTFSKVLNSMYECNITRTSDGAYFSNEPVAFVSTEIVNCGTDTFNTTTGQCETPPPNNMFLSAGDYREATPFDPQSCSNEESNSSPPVTTAGNPIDTKDGNKSRQENDFNTSGISPLKFTRYYNSQKNQSSTLGTNWSHSYTTSLTANIHTEATPYVSGDSNFSSLNATAQLACESGWNDIKATYNKPELASSTVVYLNNACGVQDANGNSLGSIAVRDNSTGGVSPNPPQDTVVIERANGNTIVFTLVNSVWTAPSDTDVSLIQTASGYTLTTAQDTVEEYTLTGQLVSTTDRKGIQQTLTYNATTGLLESVTDSFGQSLGFTYTGMNLTSVTLPDTTTLTYAYDANNNFSSVKREDTSVKTYVYEDVRFPNALTGIIDENTQRYMTFTYDALGRAITSELGDGTGFSAEKVTIGFVDDTSSTVTDALGKVRTYRFTTIKGEKKLSALEGAPCTSCGGSSAAYTYDANGYVGSKTDFNGNVTSYVNNTRGLPTTMTEAVASPVERVTTYTWHPQYALPTCVIETARTTALSYTPKGSLETRSVIDTSNTTLFSTPASKTCDVITARTDYASLNKRVTAYTYYPNYELLKTIDGPRTDVNDVTTFAYDASGNLSTITNALSQITELKNYTLRGKPQTLVDANGLITSITYDVRGRVDLVTVGQQVTNYDFDAVGNLDKVTRPDGSFIDYDYDAAHRLTDIRDQLGNHIHYVLDALGNTTSRDVKDSAGVLKRTSSAIYNQLSQLEKTIGAALQTTDYLLYDGNGNLKHLRDAEGKNTFMSYDALNRLEVTTNELTNTSTTIYDAHDNITRVTDLRGLETTYQYDGLGNRTQQTSPDTGITQYTSHDDAGNVLTMIDAKNQTTLYQYDVLNRVDLVTYNDGTQADYIYDQGVNAKGRVSSVSTLDATSAVLNSVSWGYDVYGNVDSKAELVNGVTLTTTYIYNPVTNQLTSKTTPAGHVVGYGYTSGQVTSLSVDGNTVMSNITYDPFAAAKGWTWGNGQVVNRNFDQDGQLDTYTLGQTTFDNNYTPAGNVHTITDLTTPTNVQTFNYDGLHRLKDYSSLIGNEVYDYDANSNRTLLTDVLSATTDNYVTDTFSNKLSSLSGLASLTYGYDANGNITSKLDPAGLGQSYTYNTVKRMASVKVSSLVNGQVVNTITSYAHNALGQRVSKTTGAVSTLFGYGEQGELTGVYHQAGTAQEEIVYFAGAPVATLRGSEVFYIHTDHLGTPRSITDNTNTVKWSWHSDPFGKTLPNEDVDSDGVNVEFNLRFAGQYYDVESGLHYNYFRDYDPSTGRYVQSDPIGLDGGLNTYGYVGGNPLGYVDPYGKNAITFGRFIGQATYAGTAYGLRKFGLTPILFAGGVALADLINNPPAYLNEDASDHPEEDELLGASCEDASWAIPKLRALIESRKRQYKASGGGRIDLNPSGPGHKQRIKKLEDKLRWLEQCPKSCD